MSFPVRISSFELGPKTPVYQGKFIVAVALGPAMLEVYGGPVAFHNHLSMLNGVQRDNVLGGGKYTLTNDTLKLFDTSIIFGSIHSEAREEIAKGLVTHLARRGFNVTSTDISELKEVSKSDRVKNWTKWEYIGFPVVS